MRRRELHTEESAEAELRGMSQSDLFETTQEDYRDFYDTSGRHMVNYSIDQLVVWYLAHYKFSPEKQRWQPTKSWAKY